ncbi:MAG TPA: biotin/lipoyl-containing protein, partial [Myxococcota bacterium]|nr:biotin/lipoyl-containing protein [Myxococcota bacterium]
MAVEIKVPTVGESITEVTIGKWLKPAGAYVNKDEPLVTLETDKVNVEVLSPEAGLLSLKKADNETASIGEVIGTVEPGARPTAAPEASAAVPTPTPAPAASKP